MPHLDTLQEFSNCRAEIMNAMDFKSMAQFEAMIVDVGVEMTEVLETPPTVPLADHFTYRNGFYL